MADQYETFEQWVAALVAARQPHQFLMAFGKNHDVLQAGDIQHAKLEIKFTRFQPVTAGLTFDQVRQAADRFDPDWDVVFIAKANNRDNSMPSATQCRQWLSEMVDGIRQNGPGMLAAFDREGSPLANVTKPPGATLN